MLPVQFENKYKVFRTFPAQLPLSYCPRLRIMLSFDEEKNKMNVAFGEFAKQGGV